MRLTDKNRWEYKKNPITQSELEALIKREEWIDVAKSYIPDVPMEFLELGSAPGDLSAAFCHDKPWDPFGVDYSDDSSLYSATLENFGKKPVLFEEDIFNNSICRQFDMVCSFGLIEHFRGALLEKLVRIHDDFVKPGGHLVIAVPNFTGFQYFWHYMVDRPDLDNHNIDIMNPGIIERLVPCGYEILHSDYVGTMRLWGNTGFNGRLGMKAAAGAGVGLSKVARGFAKAGMKLKGRSFSPFVLYVGRKPLSK